MAKSLGQIHTTAFNYEIDSGSKGEANAFLCDGSAALSAQFNRNIRMMSIYKLVGADLVVQMPDGAAPVGSTSDRMIVKGRMRYFQPTKGRCQALRDAYQQFRAMAKAQGVDPGKNKLFDFRVLPRPISNYPVNALATENNILNTTTLDGSIELCMTEGATGVSTFASYNVSVKPVDTVLAGDFASGLDTWQSGTQTDFVLNEGTIQTGNANVADLELEEIPFELAYDSTARRVHTLNWRPDPALYIGILGGFVEIVLDEITAAGSSTVIEGVEMDISLHWAGWKSIVSSPKKKRRTRRSSKKKVNKPVRASYISKMYKRDWK